MDRRAVLCALGVGIGGMSGCARTAITGSETTASETPDRETGPTSGGETTTRDTEPTTRDAESTSETGRTTTDGCSPSAISEDRLHTHSDYGLGIVDEDTDRPAVAVVGEDWRSELRTDEMSEEDEAFVTGTDFQQSVVLVVQYTKSSGGHELRVTDYEFDENTLRADVCVVARGGPQDAPTENLFARLDHSGSVPSTVEARIERPMETVTVSNQ